MNKGVKPVVVVLVLLVLIGGIAGAAFFQDEVSGFFRLQGWNTQPVADASKQFVEAAAKGDGKRVASFLAADTPTLQPEKSGDSVVAFQIPDYGGPKRRTLKEMCPSASPKLSKPSLVFLEGGSVEVVAAYPKHRLQLSWDHKPGGWKLVNLGWSQ